MSIAGTVDVPVEIFSGLVTNISPSDLPHGVSPDCQDCSFQIGEVGSRPGQTQKYTLSPVARVNYLKTYENLLEIPRFMMLDSLGSLWRDSVPGGPKQLIQNGILGNSAKSTSLFGAEYFAFGDGTAGVDLPRQYDDTNFDRVSQVGPGAAPAVIDEASLATIIASPAGLTFQTSTAGVAANGATESGNTVTLRFTAPLANVFVGSVVKVNGVGGGSAPGYNGTFTVLSVDVPGNASVITYLSAFSGLTTQSGGSAVIGLGRVTTAAAFIIPDTLMVTIDGAPVALWNGSYTVVGTAAGASVTTFLIIIPADKIDTLVTPSGTGTVSAAGNIPAGVHGVTVFFVTRTDYFTAPAVAGTWTASGGKRAVVGNIPIGPSNVIARVLCFTAAGGANYFYVGPQGVTLPSGNMYIADNTTTTAIVDFSDAILLDGTNIDDLFRLLELQESAGVIDYASRLFWWGERNNLKNFVNLSFNGGWGAVDGGFVFGYPLGWQPVYQNPSDASRAPAPHSVFGDAFIVLGSPTTAGILPYGKIQQGAAADANGVPIIKPNTAYSVSLRLTAGAGTTQGTAFVDLFSPSLGVLGSFSVPVAGISTPTFNLFTGPLLAAQVIIPDDLQLRYYIQGPLTNGGNIIVDNIEIFPTGQPVQQSVIRASLAEDPESYNGVNGFLKISENNGQGVRSGFKLRENLYFVKEHSFFSTADDKVNQPAQWTIESVSQKVGTPSIHGVGIGEDWVVIAHRTGLYLFWGSEPVKISEEIQPTWDQINWKFGSTIWVTVDTRKRRILIGAPFGNATQPNKVLVMDYHDVGGAEEIVSSPPIRLTYTGAKRAFDKSRKWSPWTIAANCCALIEQADAFNQPDGTAQIYFGASDLSSAVNLLDDNALTDNGAQIPSYYTMAMFVEQVTEEALQLRSHRKLFSYLTMFIEGAGSLDISAYKNSLNTNLTPNIGAAPLSTNPIPIGGLVMRSPAFQDTELPLNLLAERITFKMANNGASSWFKLQKFVVCVTVDPWAPVRGMN